VAAKPPPNWDADSPRLRSNLAKVEKSIRADARKRTLPSVETARVWHSTMMQGLLAPDPLEKTKGRSRVFSPPRGADDVRRRPAGTLYVGRFRGEPGLESCGVRVGAVPSTMPWLVAEELEEFERKLLAIVFELDARYPDAESLDDDGIDAVIELAAWAHTEWVRIHPFGNGNGRTARIWANLLLMRYGLRPILRLRPRPQGAYGDAGAKGMLGDLAPMATLIRKLLGATSSQPAS
jgi:hypothetical protein